MTPKTLRKLRAERDARLVRSCEMLTRTGGLRRRFTLPLSKTAL